MSTDPIIADAPVVMPVQDDNRASSPAVDGKERPSNFLHSPPDSNKVVKSDGSDSELSDLDDVPELTGFDMNNAPEQPATEKPVEEGPKTEEVEDIGEVLPDHWSGTVPVFKPTMHQFKDFDRFMHKVDSYGMRSGIIKVIPPQEWKDAQPKLDNLVKQIRVREPIKQDIMGSNGTYRQVNILHGRSYNLPQWRSLCDQSEHQPPARRGERRANVEKPKPKPKPAQPAVRKPVDPSTPKKRGRGRPPKNKNKPVAKAADTTAAPEAAETQATTSADAVTDRPMTPVSPKVQTEEAQEPVVDSIEKTEEKDEPVEDDEPVPVGRMGGRVGGRMGAIKTEKGKAQSVSARRKYSRREGSAAIDEEAFKEFNYKMDISDYTAERCEELERAYWKTLTYAPPLYGADMMGTLFDETTDIWNLNKLPNLLDVLGTKIPGVNTAYLYLGMWKATFAWHLEDVDLYSINYLHFGAPKQWYSISQADAPKFEKAMKNIWPHDAKSCSQFLRHKGYLISPQHLQQHYGIKVNKCLSYPGEFVVTYPYGYHSGYNLGYNCAEAVNFALDNWLPMGKIAKRCECAQAQDSVWIDVHEIERKMRGEETEYEETEDELDEELSGLPTPPASHGVKFKDVTGKRKRESTGKIKVKKIKLRVKAKAEPACCLCPNDFPGMELLPTEDGRKAHRICVQYIPEPFIETEGGKELVYDVNRVHKNRLDLKCLFCRSKRGACFQCSQQKCARAYHATCAAAAGVFIEDQEVPVYGEDGTEYKEQAFEFSCRFHRTKRDKKVESADLESDSHITSEAAKASPGDICQFQYLRGDIFAGQVVENRSDERTLLVDIIPTNDRLEVEWKWLLLPDASDFHLPKASAGALPLPASHKAKERLNATRKDADKPRKDDIFGEGYTWAEFQDQQVTNKEQVNVDFNKENQIWHYLGKTSTDAKAQYTEDPSNRRHNPRGNFLDTVPKAPRPVKPYQPQQKRNSLPASYQGTQFIQMNQFGQHAPIAPAMLQSHTIQYQAASPYSTSTQAYATQPAYHISPSIQQKYAFFQVHNNRDARGYRSPYSPTGGFSNRYAPSTATAAQGQQAIAPSPYTATFNTAAKMKAPAKPKATPPPKAYKIPEKQSPVPLPPNFVAAMSAASKSKAQAPPMQAPNLTSHSTGASQSAATSLTPASVPAFTQLKVQPQVARPPQATAEKTVAAPKQTPFIAPVMQEFPDVPGSESMEFADRMVANIRRMSTGYSC